jgi:putative membrane protein
MSWIAPLISKGRAQKLVTAIQPEVDWQAIQWLGLESRAWKRVFKRVSFFILLPMAPLLYFYHGWGLLMLALLPLAFLYAKAYVNKAGYAANDEIIAYRHGVLFHTISIVKVGKIQNISYAQTPFDRRNGMARITVDTAGSNPVSQDINIHYLDVDKVENLMAKLSTQVSQAKFVW